MKAPVVITCERGFTLVEMLVAMCLGLLIMGAAMTALTGAERHWKRQEDRSRTLDDTRDGFLTLSRELRVAVEVTPISSGKLQANTLVRRSTGGDAVDYHEILYDCTKPGTKTGSFDCTRTDQTAGTPASTMISGITSSNVFTTSSGSRYIGIRMERPVRKNGSTPLVISGGVTPRNCLDTAGLLAPCGGL